MKNSNNESVIADKKNNPPFIIRILLNISFSFWGLFRWIEISFVAERLKPKLTKITRYPTIA